MDFEDKVDMDHGVYRIFDEAGVIVYIGMSSQPMTRIRAHSRKSWHREIATVKVTWFDGWLPAARAEAAAIREERPKYNTVAPTGGDSHKSALRRGDGLHCPRCGEEKVDQTRSYCQDCASIDNEMRRRAAGWVPRSPAVICPKCGGQKEAGPAYCRPCKVLVNRAYHQKKALEKRGLA